MEIIRAIISIFLGLLFISFIIKITWPILVVFGVFILYMVINIATRNRSNKNRAQSKQAQFNQRQNRTNPNTSQSSTTRRDPNVIDAEFTEEELD